jgi:hypothetical protein
MTIVGSNPAIVRLRAQSYRSFIHCNAIVRNIIRIAIVCIRENEMPNNFLKQRADYFHFLMGSNSCMRS